MLVFFFLSFFRYKLKLIVRQVVIVAFLQTAFLMTDQKAYHNLPKLVNQIKPSYEALILTDGK